MSLVKPPARSPLPVHEVANLWRIGLDTMGIAQVLEISTGYPARKLEPAVIRALAEWRDYQRGRK